MSDPLEPKPRPGRIIIPGAENEPEAGAAPRIVLPPGVAAETAVDLPQHPKLRPLVLMPFNDGKREVLLVTDPTGVMPAQPVLGIDSLPLLQLLDGSLSLNDIITAVTRESKDIRVANMVRDFIGQLDELLMLDSPRFETAYKEVRDAYHQLEIRPASLEGHSYPAEPDALKKTLDEHFAAAEKMRVAAGDPVAPSNARPRALMSPHLDPRRAGPTIARAFLELGPDQEQPLRVVVFGTGHSLIEDRFALTRKHFETPLGLIRCDTKFVDAMAARLGEAAFHSELVHRDEHSIEFQTLYLKHRLGDRPIQMVPILCGGFHTLLDQGKTPRDDPEFEALIAAVREVERELGGATVYVAGVDLSHIGTRFGDPPVDDRTRKETDEWDREALSAAHRGDADGWFAAIAAHDDQTRICGLAPTYAMLRAAEPGEGRLLHYEQSEEQGGSLVSIAAVAWS